MKLIKIRVSYIDAIAHSLYANDSIFLSGSTLDQKVKEVSNIQEDNFCYQVTMINGAQMGFFCVPKDRSRKVTKFYIKVNAREKEFVDAFWKLISDTLYGEVYESISDFYMEKFDDILSSKLPILGGDKFYGSDYILN